MLGNEQRQCVEHLPAGLGLRAIQGVHQLLDKGGEQIGLALGEQVHHASGELARATARAGQVLDEGGQGVGTVLDAREAGGLLGGKLDKVLFCHGCVPLIFLLRRTSELSYGRAHRSRANVHGRKA